MSREKVTSADPGVKSRVQAYLNRFNEVFSDENLETIDVLGQAMRKAWGEGARIYLCGNGGSAGNANHLANDFNYGIAKTDEIGLRIESLAANASVVTCLANDIGYENVFSQQLRVKAEAGDILIALSGSGNSMNVVNALQAGNELGMETFAILGYTGGKSKAIAKHPIHFAIDDMQIAEDIQLIVGHILMQYLCEMGRPPTGNGSI